MNYGFLWMIGGVLLGVMSLELAVRVVVNMVWAASEV